jgi:hypothetical protein
VARPTLHTEAPESYQLEVRIYGDGSRSAALVEELEPEAPFDKDRVNLCHLVWDGGKEELSCQR